jgi:hypothetical protein
MSRRKCKSGKIYWHKNSPLSSTCGIGEKSKLEPLLISVAVRLFAGVKVIILMIIFRLSEGVRFGDFGSGT